MFVTKRMQRKAASRTQHTYKEKSALPGVVNKGGVKTLDKSTLCTVKNLHYGYVRPVVLEVLRGVTFCLKQGEHVALMGASGSGKSTLLHLLGLLDMPKQGELCFYQDGEEKMTSALSEYQRMMLRRQFLGLIYQFHYLLPELSAEENVFLPLLLHGMQKKAAVLLAQEFLKRVGLRARMQHKPSQLSGGEQQRVAIARALVTKPKLLLGDEPTGSLDEKTGDAVMKLIHDVAEEVGATLFIATHNPTLAAMCHRTLFLRDGVIVAS